MFDVIVICHAHHENSLFHYCTAHMKWKERPYTATCNQLVLRALQFHGVIIVLLLLKMGIRTSYYSYPVPGE